MRRKTQKLGKAAKRKTRSAAKKQLSAVAIQNLRTLAEQIGNIIPATSFSKGAFCFQSIAKKLGLQKDWPALVYALEPNRGMLRRAEEQRRRTQLDIEFLDLPGERIPLPNASVDTVVSTFTLCTIPGVVEAIRGIGRVLRPGGKLIFFEHGLSPDPLVRRWQKRSEPLFRWAFDGCHVTRDIPSLISEGGFGIEQMDAEYLAPFPKSGSYCWWGVALPELRSSVTRMREEPAPPAAAPFAISMHASTTR